MKSILPAALLAAFSFPLALQAHPIVAGFERFHAGGKDPVRGGQLLIGELNCTSCHASESVSKKQAPNLDQIGTRANLAYLQKYLSDPHAIKPGTTMPDLFAGDPEKASKIEALTHLLASTGALKQARPDLKAVIRGKDFYARTGCAACHGARDMTGEPAKASFPFAIPLGDLKAKYAIPGLASFLANPLAIRSSGRMPHLLKPAEANDVANYLLQGVKVGLPTGKGTTRYSYFEGDWQSLPDFDKLKAKAQGAGVAFDVSLTKKESNYALRFEGVFLAERAGEYRFHLNSDDGSRLFLDGNRIVNNDGIHPTTHQSAAIEVTKGLHKLTVEYFQGGGEAVLEVEIEGPGLGRQPLGPMVAATEAELNAKAEEPKTKEKDAFVLKSELVEKGKQIFASVGCANCHQLNVAGKAIAPNGLVAKAKGIDAIKKDGCLSEKPTAGLPDYHFTAEQRLSISEALHANAPQKISNE